MIDIRALLKGTDYEPFAEKIARACERKGWQTIEDVQNLPGLGLRGFDIYSALATINEQHAAPAEIVEVEVAEKKPQRKKATSENPAEPDNKD